MALTAMTFLTGCSSLSKKFPFDVKKDSVFLRDRPDLKMDAYRPQAAGRLPVVLVIHGGGWRSRSGNMASICRDLAAQGFLALNVTYRLSPQHIYPAALDDVRTILKYVREAPAEFGADPERVFARIPGHPWSKCFWGKIEMTIRSFGKALHQFRTCQRNRRPFTCTTEKVT